MSRGAAVRAALLASALAALSLPARAQQQPAAGEGWRPFTATWTLSGQRYLLPTEGVRPASILHLSGPMTVMSGDALGRGYLVEIIGFDDGATLVGRTALTDEHGDRIYSTIKAAPSGGGRRGTATITGGSGRYAGAEGSYTFSWEYVVDAGDGEISIRAGNLEGRIRRVPPRGGEAPR